MVGDVTFQLLSRIGIRTIQTLSEMPCRVLQQMIGKKRYRYLEKANGIDNNPSLIRRENPFRNTPLGRTLSTFKIKINTGMVENWLFSCVLRTNRNYAILICRNAPNPIHFG
jgi:DNA polymerase-4